MSAGTGIPTLTCEVGGVHQIHSTRLTIATAWLRDMSSVHRFADATARYWLGWEPSATSGRSLGANGDPLLWYATYMRFIARDRRAGTPVASIALYQGQDGAYHVGGLVDSQHRGQGYGREMLDTVCQIAHRHLGIAELTAGCEIANVASRRWLASCGFVPAPGPSEQALTNGRVIKCCWWRRSERAVLRCQHPPVANILPARRRADTDAPARSHASWAANPPRAPRVPGRAHRDG